MSTYCKLNGMVDIHHKIMVFAPFYVYTVMISFIYVYTVVISFIYVYTVMISLQHWLDPSKSLSSQLKSKLLPHGENNNNNVKESILLFRKKSTISIIILPSPCFIEHFY